MALEIKEGVHSDGGEWVLDSLVGYLRSPVWQEPLMKFLEDQSVVFGPEDEEQWQIEFERVFEEYKDLIDSLLEIHMKEMDISPEQFEDACQMAEGILSAKLHQSLFEQIWAASDFDTFKRMMIQLNIDLQLHALEVLASRYGLVPNAFLFDGVSNEEFVKEDPLFKEAVRRSLAEIEPPSHLKMVEVHRIPDDIVAGGTDLYEKQHEDKKESIQTKSVVTNEKRQNTGTKEKEKTELPVLSREKSSKVVRKFWQASSSKEDGISVDEIRSRQEYLRRQRDKLLEIKKGERQKQLERMEENAKRPKTGRPASRAISRVSSAESNGDTEQTLKYRQSLAARIKSEVVDAVEDEKS